MIRTTDGNWRRVTIDGALAIKTPRPDRPQLLNLWEWELWTEWQPRYRWDYLCPAIRCSDDGGELVMRAADPCVDSRSRALRRLWDEIEERYRYVAPLGECKVGDWGVLKGRLVLLDYGAECFTETEIAAARAALRRYVDRAEAER